ncbi:MAG: VWA domain-containing protein [Lachnospiraceae bacterium]|nr:VWA domain-containing protein [Lachnospiraceae bacterium]
MIVSMVLNVSLLYGTGKNVFAAEDTDESGNGSRWATASNARYRQGEKKDVDIYIVANDNEIMPGNETELTLYLKNNTEEDITDGVLKFKSRYIQKENAGFVSLEEAETGPGDDGLSSGMEESAEELEEENRDQETAEEAITTESETDADAAQELSEDEQEAAEQKEFQREFGSEDEEEDSSVLDGICLLSGELYPVQFTFYTDDDAEMAKASVEFIFKGEGESRSINSSEKWYYGIGMPYVSLELAGGTELEAGVQNEMNIWMTEPSWYLDDWDEKKQEEREEKYREQITTVDDAASPSQAKRKASSSNAERDEIDLRDGRIASPSKADKEETQANYTDQAMYIEASRVSYEVTVYGARFRRFRPSRLKDAEDIGWINCLYEAARDTKPGRYYGKVTATGKWHKKSFISTQGFWFEITGEGRIKLSGNLDQGMVTVEGPMSSFPEAEALKLQVSDLDEEQKQQVAEALGKQAEEENISITCYRALQLMLLADEEETELLDLVRVKFDDVTLTDCLPEENGDKEAETKPEAEEESREAKVSQNHQETEPERKEIRVYHLDEPQLQVNEITCSLEEEHAVVVETDQFSVYVLAEISDQPAEEEPNSAYERFKKEIEALEAQIAVPGELEDEVRAAVEEVLQRLNEAFSNEELKEEEYAELHMRLYTLLYGSVDSLAEPSYGSNWIELRDSGWFEEYSEYADASEDFEASEEPEDPEDDMAIASKPMSQAVMQKAMLSSADSRMERTAVTSDQQVADRGGSRSGEGNVTVSKTIAGTELENVFDITLKVQTQTKISEIYKDPDMAVVIVMDISNTMTSDFGGVTRYYAAMDAAERFLDTFAKNNSGNSRVGYVAFNTDAQEIFGLQACSEQTVNQLKNTMRTKTGNIINGNGYGESHKRFTNIEAGLKMASDMISRASNKNKYIIFLSDGFPTTYIQNGYVGYDTYDSRGTVFKDRVLNKPCTYGTSYSDEAAIRARKMATAIKNSGVEIFSIGVDVGGQSLQRFIKQSEDANGYSVVDRSGTSYEIGNASSLESYKNWLGNKIGSGHYYDSTNYDGLNSAYEQIFEKIKEQIEAGSKADWVSRDPIPTINGSADTVEFIGFYDKAPQLVGENLTGTNVPGGENTAVFQNDDSAISWDLKNSGYQSTTSGNVTTYTYQLVYRVRLKNEKESFLEENIYPTNDTTTLNYRYVESQNGNVVISDPKTMEFPIPSVKGYLSELKFKKTDSFGRNVSGAEFTLSHDASKCTICRGDGSTSVAIQDMTRSSGADGSVHFERIPSGHQYILTETKVPDGYMANKNTYHAAVAYDVLTVTVTAPDGTVSVWDNGQENTIVNSAYIELPETGGRGILPYTMGGLLMMAGSMSSLLYNKKRRKEETASS